MDELNQNTNKKIKSIIEQASNRGSYQKWLILFLSLVWAQITLSAMDPSFVFMNPLFKCQGESATEIQACKDLSKCDYLNKWTATYYAGFYCDKQSLRSLIQSFYPIGTLLGMVILPTLADIIGRKKSILLAIFLGIIGNSLVIIGIYTFDINLILVGQIVSGIFDAGIAILSYVITAEFCSQKQRQRAVMIYNAAWGGIEIMFLFFYEYFNEWYNYLVLLVLIPLFGLLLIGFFFLVESPRFLIIKKRDLQAAKKSLETLSMYDFSHEKLETANQNLQEAYKEYEQLSMQQQQNNQSSIKKILKDCGVIKIIICISLAQSGYNLFYYGVQASLERTGFTYGVSMALVGIHEFLGFLFVSYFIVKLKRKKGLLIVNSLTALLGLSFIIPFIKNTPLLQSFLISVTRVSCVFSYSFITMIEIQSFPSNIQSTAMGMAAGLSQLGRFATPFIINKMNDIGIFPIIAVSILLLIFGVVPVLFLKQPKKKEDLEQSLTEGEINA